MFQKTFESYFLLLVIPVSICFLVGFVFIYLHYKRSIRTQKKIKSHYFNQVENEKIIISRELHDAISPFTLPLKEFIKKKGLITIEDEKKWINEINKFEIYLTKINDSIFPSELLDGNLNVALQILTQKLSSENKKIVIHSDFNPKVSKQNSIQIFRIIQECLINGLKYSGSPFYNLLCTQIEFDLICTVNYQIDAKNNIDYNGNSHRRGRKIMTQRLEILSAKYEISINQNLKTEKFIFKDIFK